MGSSSNSDGIDVGQPPTCAGRPRTGIVDLFLESAVEVTGVGGGEVDGTHARVRVRVPVRVLVVRVLGTVRVLYEYSYRPTTSPTADVSRHARVGVGGSMMKRAAYDIPASLT